MTLLPSAARRRKILAEELERFPECVSIAAACRAGGAMGVWRAALRAMERIENGGAEIADDPSRFMLIDGDGTMQMSVWPFNQAPAEFQALSRHGGDEDWLVHISAAMYARNGLPDWCCGSGFGVCGTSEHVLPDGSVVAIGAHA